MPNYGMPGVAITNRGSQMVGFVAFGVAVLVTAVWLGYNHFREDDHMHVAVLTETIGAGIGAGTTVALNGVKVGSVTSVDSEQHGTQRITLALDRSRLFGLTDRLTVDYAPANLFGISEVELKPAPGGSTLVDGTEIDLTGTRGNRVTDATMGALMRSLTQTTDKVLTPQFTDLITEAGTNLEAFTPMLEAIVSLTRTIADTQRFPSSFLIEQYASAVAGFAPMGGGVLDFIEYLDRLEILRTQPELFDSTVNMLVHQLLPEVTTLGYTLQQHFAGYADVLTPLLAASAQSVPTPAVSSAQLRELLSRLDRSFTDTPEGPMLDLELTLRGVPAVAVPLLGLTPGGVR